MRKTVYALFTLASMLAPQFVLAHEGHGSESPLSPGHYVANPEHFIPLALAIAAVTAFVAVRYYKIGSKQNK